jgi:hypothetical protein
MFVRSQPNGELILIGQTDHSRLVGQLAAHWGNQEFARPTPYESVVRGAIYHDFGWLKYETNPLIDPKSGKPYEFRQAPSTQEQLDSYQWCIDWLSSVDPYTGLLVCMHRTGLWKGRYGTISHPTGYYARDVSPEIEKFISSNETRQEKERAPVGQASISANYHLLQVWDILGLYFCCQEPYDDHIEPVPTSYSKDDSGVRLTMKPLDERRVAFEPYPFDVRPFKVKLFYKKFPQSTFANVESFRSSYFQAEPLIKEYEVV